MITIFTWDNADITWDHNEPHLWDFARREIIEGGHDWSKDKGGEKRKKLIKLVMWRKGIKVYDESKEVKNIKLYADDIKLIAEEIKRNVQIIH